MARSEIYAGICGFKTEVETRMEGSKCMIQIKSTLKLGAKHCAHAACPVPVIKAIEVEAGLALPADVIIKISK